MGNTYRTPPPNPESDIPFGREVKENTRAKFTNLTKQGRKYFHHQDRHQTKSALRSPLAALLTEEAL
jgi:hypothetical protein